MRSAPPRWKVWYALPPRRSAMGPRGASGECPSCAAGAIVLVISTGRLPKEVEKVLLMVCQGLSLVL